MGLGDGQPRLGWHCARAVAYTTRDNKYHDGAVNLSHWLLQNTKDTPLAGGYTGGLESDGKKVKYKSSEDNIDLLGLFSLLHELTASSKRSTAAGHAQMFVDAMWAPQRWEVGTLNDGVRINTGDYIPEDVQAWGYLATNNRPGRVAALDWNIANIQVTDSSRPQRITGVRFPAASPGAARP
jgi:hypothetical protein